MLFIDLDKIQIVKEKNFNILDINLTNLNWQESIFDLADQLKEIVKESIRDIDFTTATRFNFIIADSDSPITQTTDFESITNVILTVFCGAIAQNKGRAREHRLDMPWQFADVNIKRSLIKKLVNYKTLVNKFNIVIRSTNFFYYSIAEGDLCDN